MTIPFRGRTETTVGREAVRERYDVSRETLDRLNAFVALLGEWQETTNLVAPSTLQDVWSRHIADSLQLAAVASEPRRWVDLGSGAGFPGLVLAIAAAGRPGAWVDLIESNSKKAAFLRAAIRRTGIPAAVHCQRIEACGAVLLRTDAVSARALAPLDVLLGFVVGRTRPDAPCFFMKGLRHEEEIAAAAAHWRFTVVKHPSMVEPGAAILEIGAISRVAGPNA